MHEHAYGGAAHLLRTFTHSRARVRTDSGSPDQMIRDASAEAAGIVVAGAGSVDLALLVSRSTAAGCMTDA